MSGGILNAEGKAMAQAERAKTEAAKPAPMTMEGRLIRNTALLESIDAHMGEMVGLQTRLLAALESGGAPGWIAQAPAGTPDNPVDLAPADPVPVRCRKHPDKRPIRRKGVDWCTLCKGPVL